MIHKITFPTLSGQYLREIMSLQRQVLYQLCQPGVPDTTIDAEWLIQLLVPLGYSEAWVRKLAGWKDQIENLKKPLVEHMDHIARLPNSLKVRLIDAFDYDTHFEDAFRDPTLRPYRLRGCSFLANRADLLAVRGFLTAFYAPVFYQANGYELPIGGGTVSFHKGIFLEEFHQINPKLHVCPYCDGYPDGEQVDHFFPKGEYPALSCHPLNLVPSCFQCNMKAKGTTAPISPPPSDPNEAWFHPYLNALADWVNPQSPSVATDIDILLDPNSDSDRMPEPISSDHLTNLRLKKLDNLSCYPGDHARIL